MPNPLYNNMHGANRKGAGEQSNQTKGAPATVPERMQKDRSGGTPKRGPFGPFHVKPKGI